jgi:hypothetical protein
MSTAQVIRFGCCHREHAYWPTAILEGCSSSGAPRFGLSDYGLATGTPMVAILVSRYRHHTAREIVGAILPQRIS